MCGINGFISHKITAQARANVVKKMNADLAHRGPDHEGFWNWGFVSLGHRRLCIIDPSPESNQPFFSADSRYIVVYNGELYNFQELKLQLQRAEHGSQHQPHIFRTASDTEVVLASYMRWGARCLDLFNGIFAFAIYDTQDDVLFMARDRFGVKPIYYYWGDEGLLFSSEIRPMLRSGVKSFSLNREVIGEYMMYQTVLAPATIVNGIRLLMPGHYAELKHAKLTTTSYYSPNAFQPTPSQMSYQEVCAQVNELLSLSVQRRLVSDVPFGAFLSGGIDSSAVVGLMSKVSPDKVETFNVSFDESEFSESKYARAIAKKFNTRHHEIKLSPADFLVLLPEALSAMDHPGGDGPNTYVVSKATRNAGITMALSGIGGDELFAGYDIFKRMANLSQKAWVNAVPQFVRQKAGQVLKYQKRSVSGDKMAELLALRHITFNTAYPLSRTVFTNRELAAIVRDPNPYGTMADTMARVPQMEGHLLSAVSLAEINTYLQNVLLRDSDQMGMAVALEIREPFLDYKLVDFVLGVNDKHKFPHSPKKLLVDSLGDLLPPETVNRPKMGFTLPWRHWLVNDLRAFCEHNMNQLAARDFCHKAGVLDLWKRFLADDRRVTWSRVWHLVVLNSWLNENKLT